MRRWIVPAIALAAERRWFLVLAAVAATRSAVFVFWPGSHFDSDQAITGLMAKHLAELRAFPVFWYGQTYMLGVEAWLAAPLMAVAGASRKTRHRPATISRTIARMIRRRIRWCLII